MIINNNTTMEKSQKKYTGRLTPEQRAEIMGEAFDEARERQEKREQQEKAESQGNKKQKLSRLKMRVLKLQKIMGIPINPKYIPNPLPTLKKRKSGK